MNLFSPRTQIHNDNSPSNHGEGGNLELAKKVKRESFTFLPEETNNPNSDYGNLGSGFFLPDQPESTKSENPENKSEKNPICNDV